MRDEILAEAKRLFDMGLGIHWIRPNSKIPVKAEWTAPTRDPWPVLKREYRPGMGLGVRLGAASCLGGGYLANIDVDIKSSDPRHRAEALAFVKGKFLKLRAPTVVTGNGLRLFVTTAASAQSGKLGASSEECLVRLPGSPLSRRQRAAVGEGRMTEAELADGWRVRPAWEVEFMSSGRQVVLPPSTHPETGRKYAWREGFDLDSLALPQIEAPIGPGSGGRAKAESLDVSLLDFPVDLMRLPLATREVIVEGDGVSDRSAVIPAVIRTMIKLRYSESEILSVLTNRKYFLGETAYEHAQTDDRARAAKWIQRFSLPKGREMADPAATFRNSEIVSTTLSAEDSRAQLADVVGSQPELQCGGKNGSGTPKPTLENVLAVLGSQFGTELFREDLFSGYHVYGVDTPWGGRRGEEFTDRDRRLLLEWLIREWQFEPGVNVLFDAVGILAARNPFHPIRDYLSKLEWDGVARLDTWLEKYMRAHDVNRRYLREVSRKVLVAMVARAFEPGCKFDYMLILKGPQGVRKSSALEALAGDPYFTSTELKPGDKDTILKMRGKWLVEFGELSALKSEVKALKNFLTTRTDRDRMPFDHVAQDFKRRCIFVGSTNEEAFLHDETGNRRFWPVQVESVDLKALSRDRDQLFAEAKAFYDIGEPLYLSESAEEAARKEQARWTPDEDVLVERVRLVLERNAKGDTIMRFPVDGFTLHEVMEEMQGRDDIQTQRRIGAALRANGYIQRSSRTRGKAQKLWFDKSF